MSDIFLDGSLVAFGTDNECLEVDMLVNGLMMIWERATKNFFNRRLNSTAALYFILYYFSYNFCNS